VNQALLPFPRVSPKNRSSKTRPHHSRSYLQAREIQRVLFNNLLKRGITDCDFMHLARAWCSMEDCIRNMKMIPRIKGVNMSAIALVR
jgi:hypothetical protein